ASAKATDEPAGMSEKALPEREMDTDTETETEMELNDEAEALGSGGRLAGGGRKRKRHLYNSIRAQMEFYFGDANLSKDRFLSRYVNQDPYVPLELFLTFNKIKCLTQDVEQIAKALGNSELLELDESALKVRRKTKLPAQREVKDRTLYVEALPANATHEWLKDVFSRYGTVAYVSLPHYPGTSKIKEFAFIEFERTGSMEKALRAFSQVQGLLAMDTDPGQLASVRCFNAPPLQQQQHHHHHQQQKQQEPPPPPVLGEQEASHEESGRKGLKREATGNGELQGLEAKRAKLEEQSGGEHESSATEETDAGETDAEATAEASEVDKEEEAKGETKENQEATKKRRRKRKKKTATDQPNIDPSALDLKVLPKTSWSSLRNKYLNLQRRIVSEAKSKLWREQHPHHQHHNQLAQAHTHPHHQHSANATQHSEAGKDDDAEALSDGGGGGGGSGEPSGEPGPIPVKRRKAVHKMNMNFYGAGGGEATKSEEPSQERTPLFKYEPGLIVECTLLEPCTNIKEFKKELRQYPEIKYVDIREGDQVAHLRLSTPPAAEELVRQASCAERQLKVLRGQPETLYWRKIEQDREAKLSKKVRVQQKRGREKACKLLATHIKFDDAEEGDAQVQAPMPV
ncbi:hypothetical protein KR018_009076, partial [Drosophila ironensis]